jgi:predicted Rossmann-fold nucleotide-binding protein
MQREDWERETYGRAASITLDDQKQVIRVLEQSVQGLWEVVNNLSRLKPTKQSKFRVTIFGSGIISHEHPVYALVRELSAQLTRMSCSIITGGGQGLMEAANEGTSLGKRLSQTRSMGMRVHLPFNEEDNSFVTQLYEHGTFFSRLHHFVLLSEAFIIVPGGIGTVLELSMVWQLLQARKMEQTPLILIGNMWTELMEWGRKHMLKPDFILANPNDFSVPRCVETADEAVAIIRQHHKLWRQASHSKRVA